MESAALLSVMSATAINSAMPGPCMVLIATRAALSGRPAGLRVSLGVAAAQLIYVFVALGMLVMAWAISETAHAAMRVVGATVLVVLGVQMFRQSAFTGDAQSMLPSRPGGDFLVGLCVGLSSPFNLIFMFAILPQFIAPEALLGPDLGILIAGIFVATMVPMVATAWLGAGTRTLGQRYLPLLTRIAASGLILFAGLTVASMAQKDLNSESGAVTLSSPVLTEAAAHVPQTVGETKVANASRP